MSPRCASLALKHYLLKPVQRIPQYQLLLTGTNSERCIHCSNTLQVKTLLNLFIGGTRTKAGVKSSFNCPGVLGVHCHPVDKYDDRRRACFLQNKVTIIYFITLRKIRSCQHTELRLLISKREKNVSDKKYKTSFLLWMFWDFKSKLNPK